MSLCTWGPSALPRAVTHACYAQDHGHVWKVSVLGQTLYALGGEDGLRAFYTEENVKRWPGMSQNLIDAAWQLEVTPLPLT